jgi:SAM-dependent methyltransferase
MMDINIKNWLNQEKYFRFKKEVCKENSFNSCLYDSKGNPLGQYGTTHSTTLFTHLALMRYLFDLKNIFSNNPIFLDLGSGVGNVVIYAAHHDWDSYGIEISKNCYEASLINVQMAEESGFIKKNSAKLQYGNMFSLELNIEEFPGDKDEDDFRQDLNKFSDAPRGVVCVDLDKVDLFYHFQVERRQNILDLFSMYAKKDSLLVFVATRNDSFELPKNVILVDNELDMYVYKKIFISNK